MTGSAVRTCDERSCEGGDDVGDHHARETTFAAHDGEEHGMQDARQDQRVESAARPGEANRGGLNLLRGFSGRPGKADCRGDAAVQETRSAQYSGDVLYNDGSQGITGQ